MYISPDILQRVFHSTTGLSGHDTSFTVPVYFPQLGNSFPSVRKGFSVLIGGEVGVGLVEASFSVEFRIHSEWRLFV